MPKQDPCCARLQTQLTRAEAEVGRISRLLNSQIARNRSTVKLMAQLAEAQQALTDVKANILAHEADHSGEMA